jgi:hypothetical protein
MKDAPPLLGILPFSAGRAAMLIITTPPPLPERLR